MFQFTKAEFADLKRQIGTASLKSQLVISSRGGARRATLCAFTEQGDAMLSSMLQSKRAVRANIEIMWAFVRLRQVLATNAELARRV